MSPATPTSTALIALGENLATGDGRGRGAGGNARWAGDCEKMAAQGTPRNPAVLGSRPEDSDAR